MESSRRQPRFCGRRSVDAIGEKEADTNGSPVSCAGRWHETSDRGSFESRSGFGLRVSHQLGITLTAVGQHLAILEESGLAVTEKVGRVRTCQMASRGLDALESWVRQHRSEWEMRMDAFERLLDE